MSGEFAKDIIDEFDDNRCIEERRGIAEVAMARLSDRDVTTDRQYNQSRFETAQENYLKETSKREVGDTTHRTTVLRESSGGIYVLKEQMQENDYESKVFVSEDAIYSGNIDDKQRFDRLIESLNGEDNEDITFESQLEGEYVARGAPQ